jgi:hypothetical protein
MTTCICGDADCRIPWGTCHCGCGRTTHIARQNDTRRRTNQILGRHLRFINHHCRIQPRVDFSDAAPFKIDGAYCKLLSLSRGLFAIVDAADYEMLSQWPWCVRRGKNGFYVERACEPRFLHRFLLGLVPGDGIVADHINGNTLDNRRSNLRRATPVENLRNTKMIRSNNTSGFKGVRPMKKAKVPSWTASITVNGRLLHLGCFLSPEEAHATYIKAAEKYFGEFRRTQ